MAVEWEEIIDSVQLDRVLDELGVNVVHIIRSEHFASCPLPDHPGADANPSFSVNEETLLWHCFTCNEGGLLPSLVAQVLGYETDDDETAFQKGVYWLLPFSDGEMDTLEGYLEQIDRYADRATAKTRIKRWHALPYYSHRALDRYEPCPVEMLEKWHITSDDTVAAFDIRYDAEHRRKETDYFGPAVIVPHWWKRDLVGFQERWLGDRPKWLPKYTNTDEFPKKHTLFNFERAVEAAKVGIPVTVVEAALTVARLHQIGFPAVGTFGASITEEQMSYLSAFPTLVFARDEDAAGRKAFRATVEALSYKVALYRLPKNPIAKGDLADLDDDQVFALYDSLSLVSDT